MSGLFITFEGVEGSGNQRKYSVLQIELKVKTPIWTCWSHASLAALTPPNPSGSFW